MGKDSKDGAAPMPEINRNSLAALGPFTSEKMESIVGAAFEPGVIPTMIASVGLLSSGTLSSGLALVGNSKAFAEKLRALPQAKIPTLNDFETSVPALFLGNSGKSKETNER